MTKVKVFVYGQRQRQQQQRRGYDNSSPDFCHGELKKSLGHILDSLGVCMWSFMMIHVGESKV